MGMNYTVVPKTVSREKLRKICIGALSGSFGSRITWSSGCGLFEGTRTLDERPEPPSRLCGVLLIIYAIAGSNLGAFNEVAERFLFSLLCLARRGGCGLNRRRH